MAWAGEVRGRLGAPAGWWRGGWWWSDRFFVELPRQAKGKRTISGWNSIVFRFLTGTLWFMFGNP